MEYRKIDFKGVIFYVQAGFPSPSADRMKRLHNKKIMKKQKTNQEEYYDLDPVLYGDLFRVKLAPGSPWLGYSFSEFAGWLKDTGRIEHQDNDREYISAHCMGQSYQEFWRDLAISMEADSLIREWVTCGKRRDHDAWISEIRQPSPAGELKPTGYTPEQEASLYDWHDMNDFSHPNEKV